MHPETLMIDAKPILNTDSKVVAIFSPGHGKAEHAGAVTIVTPKSGPDDLGSAHKLNEEPEYRDPWPFSEDCFLVAKGPALLVMNGHGQTEEIFRLPDQLVEAEVHIHEPRPLIQREPEKLIPSRSMRTISP